MVLSGPDKKNAGLEQNNIRFDNLDSTDLGDFLPN